jgi:hypothetical protein
VDDLRTAPHLNHYLDLDQLGLIVCAVGLDLRGVADR